MRFLKTSAVLLLTLLWVLASNHCALEQVVEMGVLACSSHEEAPAAGDNGCETDGCAVVENQLYKSENSKIPLTKPELVLAVLLTPGEIESDIVALGLSQLPETAPPELDSTWQFSLRASLPARAPSPLS